MWQTFVARIARVLHALPRGGVLDVVNLQEPFVVHGARRALPGVPIVLTVHGPAHRELASGYGLPLENPTVRWVRALEERAFHEADAIVSVDQAHAAYVRDFGRTERIWVIPNFVDTRRFHPDVPAQSFADDVETWIAGRPVVLCPRLLVPKNGAHVAIDAAARLRDRGVPFALVVVGDGPQRRELEARLRSLSLASSVRLLGTAPQSRMPGYVRRAAAVIVPSVPSKGVEEATSIAALEGQACARPVIASAIGGLREIVTDGVTGTLVPAGDAGALADAIARVLGDADFAARLGTAGAANVRDHHSHVAAARRYVEVYRAVGARM
jgi:glycosyltransferase involved in cell wall biosynthesis